jgi:drug/metabolite transporter (DMT)-like permease
MGEALGLVASLLWAGYGRLCREMSDKLSGSEISAHSMWRAGLLLVPLGIYETATRVLSDKSRAHFDWHELVPAMNAYRLLAVGYSVIGGGVVAYVLWNNALKHWRTSQVFLFGNLIPVTTMAWAWLCLKEQVTRTFGVAMILIVAGVVLGQTRWEKLLGNRWFPAE